MSLKILTSLLIAILGGYIAYLLNIPLPWMLGSLFTSILWNLSSKNFKTISHGRKIGQFIIGFSLGLYFTPVIIELIFQNIFLLFFGIFLCLLVSFISIILNSKKDLSFATTYFTYLPGGASEMVNLSSRFKGDKTHITLGHTTRIVILVFCVPLLIKFLSIESHQLFSPLAESKQDFNITIITLLFIAAFIGVFLWRSLKLANPWMIGSLLGTAVITYFGNLNLQIPSIFLAIAQILLAMSLAEPITKSSFINNINYLPRMFLSSLIMVGILIVLSYFLGKFFEINYLTIALGMMPGGISEMSLTALQLNLNVAIVSTMQTIRLIAVMVVAKPMYLLLQKYLDKK